MIEGIEVQNLETTYLVERINSDRLKRLETNAGFCELKDEAQTIEQPKLGLMGIRGLGNETCYQ